MIDAREARPRSALWVLPQTLPLIQVSKRELDEIVHHHRRLVRPEDQKYVGEYTTFVNNTEQAFNSYRKWVTGQAAAVKEIEMIRQSFLNKDMGPTQFKAAVAQYQAKLKRGIAVSKQMLDEGVNPKLEKNAAEYDRRFHQTATDRYHEILQRNPSLQPQQIIQMLDQEGFSGTNR